MLAWVGLDRYGFREHAERLAYRWCLMICQAFVDYNGASDPERQRLGAVGVQRRSVHASVNGLTLQALCPRNSMPSPFRTSSRPSMAIRAPRSNWFLAKDSGWPAVHVGIDPDAGRWTNASFVVGLNYLSSSKARSLAMLTPADVVYRPTA